jgi:uncharacterized membrane protein YjfL (UPF0719 family)
MTDFLLHLYHSPIIQTMLAGVLFWGCASALLQLIVYLERKTYK